MGQKSLEFRGLETGARSLHSRALSLAILVSVYAGSALAAPQYETLMTFVCDPTPARPALCGPNWLTADPTGTFFYGEAGFCGKNGTVIKLAPPEPGKTSWSYTKLYAFDFGSYPYRALRAVGGFTVDPSSGALYGATEYGGPYNQSGSNSFGSGTVFKLTPNGTKFAFSILHDFNGRDGEFPANPPILTSAGNLIGSTPYGGFGFGLGKNQPETGAVYSLASSAQGRWPQTALERFSYPKRGETPAGRLASDASGNIFGVTQSGGAYGAGTVYMVNANAPNARTVIYHFRGTGPIPGKTGRFHDGSTPLAGLISDAEGTLYGTTAEGGTHHSQAAPSGGGTIYMLKKNSSNVWEETILHNFAGYPTDGSDPLSELVLVKGVLYGTTDNGGPETPHAGTIFSLTPATKGKTAWTYKVLHNFNFTTEGAAQVAPLVSDAKGNLYGLAGGPLPACGALFKLTPRS